MGRERFIAITGNEPLTGFTAPKLLWVRNHEPEAWARARHMLLPKDYVRFKLTGEHAIDVADGAGTVLFDLAARTWSDEVVEALGLDPAMLPRTVEGPEVVGVVSEAAAAATGLRAGTPVVGGAGDQAANAVGVGAVVPGRGRHVRGDLGRRLRAHRGSGHRAGGPPPRLLPRGARHLAPHGRDALGRRVAEVAARRAGARTARGTS